MYLTLSNHVTGRPFKHFMASRTACTCSYSLVCRGNIMFYIFNRSISDF